MISRYDLLDPFTPDNTEAPCKWSPKAYALIQEIYSIYRAECFYPEKRTCMLCGKEYIKHAHFSEHRKHDWWGICELCWAPAMIRAWSSAIEVEMAQPDPLFKLYVKS